MTGCEIVLASASPRRLELLRQIGIEPAVHVVEVDETPGEGEPAVVFVERLARDKAATAALALPDSAVVIGADTAIEVDGRILGKPKDFDDAAKMLSRLSGTRHQVHTGVAVVAGGSVSSSVTSSQVFFRELTAEEIAAYWRSGEPRDKAGAYAIQGLGAIFIEKIVGSYSAIMGLPLFATARMLEAAGCKILPS